MELKEAILMARELIDRSEIALLGTNGEDGYPNIKALIKMENEGLKRVWFSTNTSSKRVSQLLKDPRACLYFLDSQKWMGLMLVGRMEFLQEKEVKARFWREGFERYYPLGVTDPDYSILRFTSNRGNLYYALSNATFNL